MLPLVALLQLGVGDSIPRVSLAEALERATRLDPNYVQAMGQVASAEWIRRQSKLVFVLPSLTASVDATKYSTAFFNIGTGLEQNTAVTGRLDARYELFSLRKFEDLSRTRAELESAEAGEVQARFQSALLTENAYYSVLAEQALTQVAAERVRRAGEQLAVARARVLSGAAVQTDSLQLLLELTQAKVNRLREDAALEVARLELGRRVGEPGPMDATPLDTLALPDLPITLPQAIAMALESGPEYRVARANERAARARFRGRKSGYLPTLNLSASHSRFDDHFFPSGRTVSSITLGFVLTIWNNADREIQLTEARVSQDVARAVRQDLERAARPEVTAAYDAYTTAKAAVELSSQALIVAQENFRVQETRYRSGATTILDLLDAQVSLSQAQAGLVQAHFAARLARAGLETILGTRLFPIN